MSFFNKLVLATLLSASMSVTAHTKELFKEVNGAKLQKILTYNETNISEAAYFAKRYRIVEVNSDLLFSDDEFTITPFEGVSITVRRDDAVDGSYLGTAQWHGIIVSPEHPSISEIGVLDMDEQQAEAAGLGPAQLYRMFFGVELYTYSWDIDKRTGVAFPSVQREQRASAFLMHNGVATKESLDLEENAILSVSGRFNLQALGFGEFRLESLQFTPKYHIIIELDSSKLFSYDFLPGNEKADDHSVYAEKQRKKVQEYNEYVNSLPSVQDKTIVGDVE